MKITATGHAVFERATEALETINKDMEDGVKRLSQIQDELKSAKEAGSTHNALINAQLQIQTALKTAHASLLAVTMIRNKVSGMDADIVVDLSDTECEYLSHAGRKYNDVKK